MPNTGKASSADETSGLIEVGIDRILGWRLINIDARDPTFDKQRGLPLYLSTSKCSGKNTL